MSDNQLFYKINVTKLLSDLNITVDEKNILQKDQRPYFSYVRLNDIYSSFIPIRTNLTHKYGFITKSSRDRNGNMRHSGLDYTKSLIFKTSCINDYIIEEIGISFKEYQKVKDNNNKIIYDYKRFLFDTFLNIANKEPNHRNRVESNIYNFSTLQYMEHIIKDIAQKSLKSG